MGGKEGEIRMKLAYNIVIGTHNKDPDDFFYCLEYPTIRGKCKNFDSDDISYNLQRALIRILLRNNFSGIRLPLKNPQTHAQNHFKNFNIKCFDKIVIDVDSIYTPYLKKGITMRHIKTGNLYKVIDFAVNANNSGPEDIQVVYSKESDPSQIYVRSAAEMLERIPALYNTRFSNIIFDVD